MPEKSQSPERKTVVVVGLGMVGIGSYSLATRRMSNTVSDSPGSDNVRWARYPRLTAHRAMPDTIPGRVAM